MLVPSHRSNRLGQRLGQPRRVIVLTLHDQDADHYLFRKACRSQSQVTLAAHSSAHGNQESGTIQALTGGVLNATLLLSIARRGDSPILQ